ncbi:Protein serine/threonine phosphatase PrpC, regulation of stationary phase [hydrothermal vent metagenome]|uniref:Protein serine/threonine phosphatase PrpC, regulation of stationary phase n=1 Tax=hydrothermal vent metagenome TaxID=652676 RepID=A0A3B0XZH8_9ZZZZ
MSLKDKIIITGMTHEGRVRDHNEDSIASNPELGLLVLADGMGGHKGGEMASAIAVDTIMQYLSATLPTISPGKTDPKTGYSLESMALEAAIKEANQKIYDASQSNTKYEGMGTTVVVLLFYDNRLSLAHVGDSRLYRMRGQLLEQMTRDHTLIQELVDRGFYTKKEARESLNKNLVTRAVGINTSVDIDLLEEVTLVGDTYLLCSDGLTDMINDDLIEDIQINYHNDLQKMNEELIKQANDYGGKDNVSVMLAQVIKNFPADSGWFSRFFDIFS